MSAERQGREAAPDAWSARSEEGGAVVPGVAEDGEAAAGRVVRRAPTAAPLRRVRDALEVVLVALLLALFARTFVVQAFRIPTGSMEPNLRVGDHLLVNKFVYGGSATAWERRWLPLREPRAGDVAVFRFPRDPQRDFVKRVVGVPGTEVAMTRRALRVDGIEIVEPHVRHTDPRAYPDSPLLATFYRRRDNLAPLTMPASSYFVLGDNRDLSEDSRYWGLVPRHYLKGRALVVYWARDVDAALARPGAAGPGSRGSRPADIWRWWPRLVR
jgi:signal peptidase I